MRVLDYAEITTRSQNDPIWKPEPQLGKDISGGASYRQALPFSFGPYHSRPQESQTRRQAVARISDCTTSQQTVW